MIYMLVFIEKQPMGSEILTAWEFWDTCATSLQSVAPSSHHTLPAVVVTLQQYYCPVTLLVATSYFSLNCYHTTDCLFIVPGTHRLKGLYIQLIVSWFILQQRVAQTKIFIAQFHNELLSSITNNRTLVRIYYSNNFVLQLHT